MTTKSAIRMRLRLLRRRVNFSYARHRAQDGGGIIRVYDTRSDLESEETVGAIPVR